MNPEREAAAEALGCGKSNRQAATIAGVSEGSIRNWLRSDPEFQAAVSVARKDYQSKVERRLSGYALRAADVVGKAGAMLAEPTAPQLAAAKLTLQAIGVAGDKLSVDHGGKVRVDVATMTPEQIAKEFDRLDAEREQLEAELFPEGYDEAAVRMWLHGRGLAFPGEDRPTSPGEPVSLARCLHLAQAAAYRGA